MPSFSNALPVYAAMVRPWSASKPFAGKIESGKPRKKQMATQFGNEVSAWEPIEVHQFGMKLREPGSCSMYSVPGIYRMYEFVIKLPNQEE